MNEFQMEVNIIRERKQIPMVEVARSMNVNRKTLYRAFNCANLSLKMAESMCEAVGETIDSMNKLVQREAEYQKEKENESPNKGKDTA